MSICLFDSVYSYECVQAHMGMPKIIPNTELTRYQD